MSQINDVNIRDIPDNFIMSTPKWLSEPPAAVPIYPPVTDVIGIPIVDVPGCVESHRDSSENLSLKDEDPDGVVVICDAGVPSFNAVDYDPNKLDITRTYENNPPVPSYKPPETKTPATQTPKTPKAKKPARIDDTRFAKERELRHTRCDECKQMKGGNEAGAFCYRENMPAAGEREAAWVRGEWDASWYCTQCYMLYWKCSYEEVRDRLNFSERAGKKARFVTGLRLRSVI